MSTPDLHIHENLINECRRGSRKAQFRLYELYSKAMFNTAFRITGNREEAEDMLQEAFTDCFRNLGSYRTESTFGAWLKTIVINRCISRLRKKRLNWSTLTTTAGTSSPEEVTSGVSLA
ncbi:MAG: sigma-70 family RNA polymerase sigma factor [Sphingobacterium sp.]|nr:sigma-70 family RNA polymerase sigma factor [Sphingobacterium sp.]